MLDLRRLHMHDRPGWTFASKVGKGLVAMVGPDFVVILASFLGGVWAGSLTL